MNIHPATVMASDLEDATWLKSSYSNGGGNCVEVTHDFPGIVPVRDSKRPAGPVLMISSTAWKALIEFTQDAEA
jgi:hypothetical protein